MCKTCENVTAVENLYYNYCDKIEEIPFIPSVKSIIISSCINLKSISKDY